MDLYVMNKSLEVVGVVDVFTSIIWTKRYSSYGDFELYLPVSKCDFNILKLDNYIFRTDDDTVMIIEKLNITTDAENGDYIIISGRSLESILSRRIVWNQTNFNGTVEYLIRYLIDKNAINADNANRNITNLILEEQHRFTETVKKQLTGVNLYEAIADLCNTYNYGMKMSLNNDKFIFSLYKGIDRSYAQSENPFVVFSPEFDNLINSNYINDAMSLANVALVAGEGEGVSRKKSIVSTGNKIGIERREIYVDSRNTSTDTEETITIAEYYEMLNEQGKEALNEKSIITEFEGEIEPNSTYIYKRDWNLGDIIQIENEFSMTAVSRIIEIIESEDASGHKIIATLKEA